MTTKAAKIDVYTPIHKALRRRLFDVAALVARTDFAAAASAAEAASALAGTLELTREHAALEDRHYMPLLEQLAPALARELAAQHDALETADHTLEALLPLVAGGDGASRVSLGAELVRRLNVFVADHLRHMDREEREAAPVIASVDEATLAATIARVRGAVAPARLPIWAALLADSLSPPELAAIRPAPKAA